MDDVKTCVFSGSTENLNTPLVAPIVKRPIVVGEQRQCKCGSLYISRNKKDYCCISCGVENKRKFYQNNKSRILERNRRWQIENRERYNERNRNYARLHRVSRNEKNKGSLRYYFVHLLSRSRVLSKESGRNTDIDLDYLLKLWDLQEGRCKLSNLPMLYEHKSIRSVSIDRIDNKIGYMRGNIQLVCRWVNLGKNSATNEEMIKIINEVRHG